MTYLRNQYVFYSNEHPEARSSTQDFACLPPSVQLNIMQDRDETDSLTSESSFSSTQNFRILPDSVQLEIMQSITQGMQSSPSISHGIDDQVPEDGPRPLESSEHYMLVSDVTTKTKEVVHLGRYKYFALQYWHTNCRYQYRNRPPFDIGRLRSACWLVVRLDRQQLVHGNLQQASKTEIQSLQGECMFAHCGIWQDRPIQWHRSPWHGDARFRRSPITNHVEVFNIIFHFCGEESFAKELEFEALLPQRSFFSGYCVGGGYHAQQWCIVLRARTFETNKAWLEWIFNLPIMVREHRMYESFLYHMD